MQIHQLSVTYQPEQDRILLRIGSTDGQEMRLWFTRRLVLGLWPLLERLLAEQLLKCEPGAAQAQDQQARQMLANFRKEELLRQADFKTPYRPAQALPLGESPLLVTDVELGALEGGRLRLGFVERPPEGTPTPRSFQLEVEAALAQGLMHLLEQAVAQAQWREASVTTAAAEDAAAAEDDPSPQRPRYLN